MIHIVAAFITYALVLKILQRLTEIDTTRPLPRFVEQESHYGVV